MVAQTQCFFPIGFVGRILDALVRELVPDSVDSRSKQARGSQNGTRVEKISPILRQVDRETAESKREAGGRVFECAFVLNDLSCPLTGFWLLCSPSMPAYTAPSVISCISAIPSIITSSSMCV